MKTAIIDGVEYVEKSTEGLCKCIVICDNSGLAMVGDVDMSKINDDGSVTIYDARCVIYWGTTKHIAELVNGPTEKTKLGYKHDFNVMKNNVIGYYKCAGGWDE